MYILGLSAYYHDSAAALLKDGQIVAAAHEERFTRIKHDPAFPTRAVEYCLREAGITLGDVGTVIFYEKPFLKFERLLETSLYCAPRGFTSFRHAMPVWLREKLFQKNEIIKALASIDDRAQNYRLLFSNHHLSHAASAFFASPFSEAMIVTMDGVGEWATTSVAIGKGNRVDTVKEINFPHSLGLLYSAFTYYLGFKVNSAEYKVMGLAPYGTPRYADMILEHLIALHEDGSFRLNMDYFAYTTSLKMTNEKFHRLLGGPPRSPESPLTQRDMDIAASIQLVLEKAVENLLGALQALPAQHGIPRHLCLAGGVALNCVANSALLRRNWFDRIWVQPAAGDAGGALGAAYVAHYMHGGAQRGECRDEMRGAQLGPAFTPPEVEEALQGERAVYATLPQDALIEQTVDDLIAQKVVGWFHGRMEFGPRALGARSILADPRSPAMQSVLNQKIKFRESFRPFAPAVLEEYAQQWFDTGIESPYMLFTAELRPEHRLAVPPGEGLSRLQAPHSTVPAITHVDFSARLQTVGRERFPLFHQLIHRFYEKTGCPMLINTSFNRRGEPMVCTPQEAYACFMGTGMDRLAIGHCYLRKEEQPAGGNYAAEFAPD